MATNETIGIESLTVEKAKEHFEDMSRQINEIKVKIDFMTPIFKAYFDVAEHASERLATSRMVNDEAYRLGRYSSASMMEACLEAQALIDACKYEEDRRAVHAFFAMGVHDRESK